MMVYFYQLEKQKHIIQFIDGFTTKL